MTGPLPRRPTAAPQSLTADRAHCHLRELRLQIRKAAGCLATIEAAGATRAEQDAARIAFHRHAEAIAHTLVFMDRATLSIPRQAGDPQVTPIGAWMLLMESMAEAVGEATVGALRHG